MTDNLKEKTDLNSGEVEVKTGGENKINTNGEIAATENEKVEVLGDDDVEIIAPETPGEEDGFGGQTSGAESGAGQGADGSFDPGRTIHININTGAGQDQTDQQYVEGVPGFTKSNKHLFVWIFSFLLGSLGIDRFVRGQFFFGLIKLITFGFSGLWTVIDFLIAFYKAYIGPFVGERYFTFFFGHWTK